MKRSHWILVFLMGLLSYLPLQGQDKFPRVYLFPGQGSDYRIFNELNFPPGMDTTRIKYPVPHRGESMEAYASRLACQVDTSAPFMLVGVSLGGMLAVELTERLAPYQTIIISSAKTRNELPSRYRWMKHFPLYKLFPAGVIKAGAQVAQPIVEPDRGQRKETFKAMLKAKNKHFMKRGIHMIVQWQRQNAPAEVYHIHGDKDQTLPLENIEAHHVIPGGSHMMVLTRASEVNGVINRLLQ